MESYILKFKKYLFFVSPHTVFKLYDMQYIIESSCGVIQSNNDEVLLCLGTKFIFVMDPRSRLLHGDSVQFRVSYCVIVSNFLLICVCLLSVIMFTSKCFQAEHKSLLFFFVHVHRYWSVLWPHEISFHTMLILADIQQKLTLQDVKPI